MRLFIHAIIVVDLLVNGGGGGGGGGGAWKLRQKNIILWHPQKYIKTKETKQNHVHVLRMDYTVAHLNLCHNRHRTQYSCLQ